jgi:hypothetical protein
VSGIRSSSGQDWDGLQTVVISEPILQGLGFASHYRVGHNPDFPPNPCSGGAGSERLRPAIDHREQFPVESSGYFPLSFGMMQGELEAEMFESICDRQDVFISNRVDLDLNDELREVVCFLREAIGRH